MRRARRCRNSSWWPLRVLVPSKGSALIMPRRTGEFIRAHQGGSQVGVGVCGWPERLCAEAESDATLHANICPTTRIPSTCTTIGTPAHDRGGISIVSDSKSLHEVVKSSWKIFWSVKLPRQPYLWQLALSRSEIYRRRALVGTPVGTRSSPADFLILSSQGLVQHCASQEEKSTQQTLVKHFQKLRAISASCPLPLRCCLKFPISGYVEAVQQFHMLGRYLRDHMLILQLWRHFKLLLKAITSFQRYTLDPPVRPRRSSCRLNSVSLAIEILTTTATPTATQSGVSESLEYCSNHSAS